MPRIPNYTPDQIAPVATTGARFRAANNNGGAFGALGEGLKTAGNVAGQVAQEQDRLNAQNDDTQARILAAEAGRAYSAVQTEYSTLRASAAREAQASINERLNATRDTTLERASNPRMRQLLEARLAGLHDSTVAQVAAHAVKEQRVEREIGFKASVASFSEQAVSTEDPAVRDTLIASALAAERDRLVEIEGLDPQTMPKAFELAELAITSKVHEGVVDRLFAQPDPPVDEVMNYLEAYGDEMSADLRADTEKRLQAPLQGRMSRADAAVALAFMPDGPVSSGQVPAQLDGEQQSVASELAAGGIPAVVVSGFLGNFEVEGGYGGARGDGGSASGIAQWRAERRANFRKMFGKDPHEATKAEQGRFVVWEMQNPGKAGMTVAQRDEILAADSPEQAAELIDRYYERSSGEHRDRRTAAATRFHGGGYEPAAREWNREQAYSAIETAAEANNWSPERTERAREELDRWIAKDEGMLREQRSEAKDAALGIVATQGDGFRVNQIPREVWNRLDPAAQAQFTEIEQRLTAPKPPTANGNTAMTLNLMRYSEADKFKTLDLREYQGLVTPAEMDTLLTQQAKLRTEGAGWTPRSGITSAFSYGVTINGLTLDPEDKVAVMSDMEAIAQQMFEAGGNKPLTDAQFQDVFRRATRSVEMKRTNFLGMESRNQRPVYDMTVAMIPDATKTRITTEFKRQMGREPNEAELLRLFRLQVR